MQNYERVIFGSACNFYSAFFCGDKISFASAKFQGAAYFVLATFTGGITNFANTKFIGGDADFSGASFFGGEVYFFNTEFVKDVTFSSAEFHNQEVVFKHCAFSSNLNFSDVNFLNKVSFEKAVFPQKAIDSESAFRGAIFNHQVNFSEVKNFPLNAFDDVEFLRKVILTDRNSIYGEHDFKRTKKSIKSDFKELGELEHNEISKWTEKRYGALERGCMALKQAMERNSDFHRAQRYFKYELLARQKRPSISWIAKRMTGLYGFFADYGGSIGRPIVSLICCIIIFGIFFALNANCIMDEPLSIGQNFIGGLDSSLTNAFRPFSIWGEAALRGPPNWLQYYHHSLGKGSWLFIKLLATFQSFFSITMLFLFGLAVKRKFQIK